MGKLVLRELPDDPDQSTDYYKKTLFPQLKRLKKRADLHDMKHARGLLAIFQSTLDGKIDLDGLTLEEKFGILAVVNLHFHNGYQREAARLKNSLQAMLFLSPKVKCYKVVFRGKICVLIRRSGWESHFPVWVMYDRMKDSEVINKYEQMFGIKNRPRRLRRKAKRNARQRD